MHEISKKEIRNSLLDPLNSFKLNFNPIFQVKLNPSEVIRQDTTSIDAFLDYLDPFLVPQSIQQQLPPSDVVGNIRFR